MIVSTGSSILTLFLKVESSEILSVCCASAAGNVLDIKKLIFGHPSFNIFLSHL